MSQRNTGADPVPAQETRTHDIPMVTRELQLRTDTWNEAERTIEVVFTTGARGARFDWNRWEFIDEELATEPANVRLERLNNGAPVLNTHARYQLSDQIGVVVPGSARMENGLGIATLRLSDRQEVAGIVVDIAAGIIRNVSVGYIVHTYEITERDGQRALYRAIDWEPSEISFVPVPFDHGAQSRSQTTAQGGSPCTFRRISPAPTVENESMPARNSQAGNEPANQNDQTRNAPEGGDQGNQSNTNQERSNEDDAGAPAPEVQRSAVLTSATVLTLCRNAGLDADAQTALVDAHVATPFTRAALMAELGERFVARDAPAPTNGRVPARAGSGVTMVRAMTDSLVHQMAPNAQLSEAGREFRGLSMYRMAEEILAQSGVNTRGLSRLEIVERSLHSTSDFSALMGETLRRRLRMAYEENQPTYRIWARRAPNAPDFRKVDVVQMSAMPELLRTNEAGEFKYGTASDGKTSYGLLTYGRIIGVSRQLLVNDDLRALERITVGYAAAAARLENRTVYAQLTSNPAMNDGTPLFHADHGNLAGSGGAISETTLGAGRTRMRLQKGMQKEELNLAPAYLIAPATQEQKAYQYTSAQYVPAKAADTNEFRAGGRTSVEPVIDAVLDGVSTTAWYLAASNTAVDTIEYTYLDGAEGVQLSSRPGFTVDGMEFKASLDFAASTIDWRGLDKNPGA
ncbi:hypothetical protein M2341_002033 [Sphingobium sp. B7D2B]|uniref:prohead protease/major capsid protein fusion protein n=1 Tax=Sphingobium sp. B7D2B TaxID=2940583 RepID=UPI0022247FA4|nr:prohead protease/major capsid protein fusion protein [Sphingobium sp. B7D2B]MCW2366586.1 hypothetical protein [Sphingobium sp. B7D2B]